MYDFKLDKELENEMKGKYLTEEYLGKFLKVAFHDYEWLHDKKFQLPSGGKKFNFRPDYCCHELKMCVEFDGPDHYTKANIIQADEIKDKTLKALDYKVIRVPYFIQLDYFSIQYLFDIDFPFTNCFQHGFVSKNVTLPASFCEQGIWKFKKILSELDKYKETGHIFDDIKDSLWEKAEQGEKKTSFSRAILNVIPSSLNFDLHLRSYSDAVIKNHKIENSNLKNNWNLVMLESSQIIKNRAGIFDLTYIYDSNDRVLEYFFYKLNTDCTVDYYTIRINETSQDKSIVSIKIIKEEEPPYLYDEEKETSSITINSIINLLFPNDD